MPTTTPLPPCTEPGHWPEFPLPDAPDEALDAFALHAETCPYHRAVLAALEELVQGVVRPAVAAPGDAALPLAPVPVAFEADVIEETATPSRQGVGYASLVFACLFVLLLIFSFSFYDAPTVRVTPQQAQACPLLYCGPSL